MPQNKKKNYGTLYGIRLRTLEDKNIKNELRKLSEEKNIPLDQLILSYLEKGLCLDGEKEINVNKEELNKDFDLFLQNSQKKIDSFENRIKMKNYEKKETLQNYILKKLPEQIQRKKFYLELIEAQFYCEKQFLLSFFSFYDYTSSEFVGYSRYFCKSHDIPFNLDTLQENIDRHLDKLHLKWFHELKTAGVIRNQKHLREVDFNYNALEKFIFELYKGEKLLYSPKERRIKSFEYRNNEEKKKITPITKGIYRKFKEIFREFVKFKWGLSNEILHMEEDDYKIFRKIGFKPCFVYEILDIEGYIRFIDDNSLGKSLTNCLSRLHLLYKQLNKFYSFPPYDLIMNINFFFRYLESVNEFLEKLPEQINNYGLYNLVQIGVYLLQLDYSKSHPSDSIIVRSKLIDSMLNEIPIKNVDKIAKIMPERYNEPLKLLKDKLLKFGIDLNKINKAGIKGIEQGRLKEREMYFKSYPKELQEKIINSLNKTEDSLKKNRILK